MVRLSFYAIPLLIYDVMNDITIIPFLQVAVFVKIPFQHVNYPYMLRICRPNLMKFKEW